jgi:hypothetical protein
MNSLVFKCIFIGIIFIKYYIIQIKILTVKVKQKKLKKVKVNNYCGMEGVFYWSNNIVLVEQLFI